jgi:hypothetical protein
MDFLAAFFAFFLFKTILELSLILQIYDLIQEILTCFCRWKHRVQLRADHSAGPHASLCIFPCFLLMFYVLLVWALTSPVFSCVYHSHISDITPTSKQAVQLSELVHVNQS